MFNLLLCFTINLTCNKIVSLPNYERGQYEYSKCYHVSKPAATKQNVATTAATEYLLKYTQVKQGAITLCRTVLDTLQYPTKENMQYNAAK